MAGDIGRPSTRTMLLKWLSSVLFGIILLVCLIESKLGVLTISNKMRQTSEMRYVRFVMLFLVVLVPSVVNMMRGIWHGAFRNNTPWPRKHEIILGLLVSIPETIGLCLFVFHIPGIKGMDQPCKVILIMNGVYLCPAIYNIWNVVKDTEHLQRKKRIVRNTFAMICIVTSVAITCWLLLENAQVMDAWSVPVAVVCLSLAWTPAVQEQLVEPIKPTKPSTNQTDAGTDDSSCKKNEPDEPWKLIIYISFLKIIFTVAVSLLLFFLLLFDKRPTLTDFIGGWSRFGQFTWTSERDDLFYFTANILGSAVGYLVAYIACTACMQRLAFSLPIFLATPVSIVLLVIPQSCDFFISAKDRGFVCEAEGTSLRLIIFSAVCLFVYQFVPVGSYIFQTQNIVLQKEYKLFLVPTYNAVLLEQWLILARTKCDKESTELEKKCKIIMCTTMYREVSVLTLAMYTQNGDVIRYLDKFGDDVIERDEDEMRQLLESIKSINLAQKYGGMPLECHIVFDGGVEKSNSDAGVEKSKFVIQLIRLIEKTLELKDEQKCTSMTPYGMVWKNKNEKLDLTIHMKDSTKVKNKKRWSQVMYMSYVLDKEINNDDAVETYILTTDADVSFTTNSVEALLELMTRDHTVGAVCARTHPLGTGPLVWYQIFEYAIRHWFQKAAEHIIGSVLCSPGCFSVYRCKAIRDVLPDYATDVNVNHAIDFLTKDMGEDRWFCTLLVQKGWRIEYCAAAENSTYCPDGFDEFFKQRRRWIASTLANMMLFVGDWSKVAKVNPHLTVVFYVYQVLLLISTLIGPSSVILVVSGGLKYAWDVRGLDSVIIQIIVCCAYTLTCLLTPEEIQLWVSKLLTFVYAVIMAVVVVGIAIEIVSDFGTNTPPNKDVNATTTIRPSIISPDIKFSTTTVYLGCMAALYLVTGLLHLRECVHLFHGLWYLLFLPSGYLILMIYSICNITDIGWGTREERQTDVSSNLLWRQEFKEKFKSIFFCFFTENPAQLPVAERNVDEEAARNNMDIAEREVMQQPNENPAQLPVAERNVDEEAARNNMDIAEREVMQQPNENPAQLPVAERNVDEEAARNNMDIAEREVMQQPNENPAQLPVAERNVDEEAARNNMDIAEREVMQQQNENPAQLPVAERNVDEEAARNNMDIAEREVMQQPNENPAQLPVAERNVDEEAARNNMDIAEREGMQQPNDDDDVSEENFWEKALNKMSLKTPKDKKQNEEDRKVLLAKLADLRNKWLMIFTVSNTIWLVLIITLANKGELFSVFGSNPVGLFVLVLFSVVTAIQFLAMLMHRLVTLVHFLARAPYTLNERNNMDIAEREVMQQPNENPAQLPVAERNVDEEAASGQPDGAQNQMTAIQKALRTLVEWFSNIGKCTKRDDEQPLCINEG